MIDKLTIAVNAVESQALFYAAVLGVQFRPLGDVRFGLWRGVELWLVPKALSGVGGRDNLVSARFVVDNLAVAVDAVLAHGGSLWMREDLGSVAIAEVLCPEGQRLELIERRPGPIT